MTGLWPRPGSTIRNNTVTSTDKVCWHAFNDAVPAASLPRGTLMTLCFRIRDSERSRKLFKVTQLSPEFGRVGKDLPLWFACSTLFPDTVELVSSGVGRPLTWVTPWVYRVPFSYWLYVLSRLKVFHDLSVKSGGFPTFLGN